MLATLDFKERLPFDFIQVPPVRLEGGSLHFRPQGPLHPATGQKERLVFDFANLADARTTPSSNLHAAGECWDSVAITSRYATKRPFACRAAWAANS